MVKRVQQDHSLQVASWQFSTASTSNKQELKIYVQNTDATLGYNKTSDAIMEYVGTSDANLGYMLTSDVIMGYMGPSHLGIRANL